MKYIFKLLYLTIGLNASIAFSQAYTWMPLGQGLSNGTNGNTYAVTSFNGKIIYGGSFTNAGGTSVSNIAAYDPVTNQWSALGSGISGEVKSLAVYNNELYAGGQFLSPGNNIAKWTGSAWQSIGTGTNGEVSAMVIFNGELAVGGNFDVAGGNNVNNIARWNGSAWQTYGGGLTGSGDRVNALVVFAGNLVAGGRFELGSANNVARWTGSAWVAFNSSLFEDDVQAVEVFNNELYAGGRFESVGSLNTKYIVKWSGSAWTAVGGGLNDGDVEALEVYKNNLIVAGNFRETGTNLYVDRIAQWTGTQWQRMLTGMNDRVIALYSANSTDTILYAGGEFTSAGGKWSYHAAKWGLFETITVSGTVRYADNNGIVASGIVKALRYDVITREVISVNEGTFTNGSYTLTRVPKNDGDLRVIIFPDDEIDNPVDTSYVPTYYPSAVLWTEAGVIDPVNNITNINVQVQRRSTSDNPPDMFGISGKVFLNTLPPPIGSQSVPYWKNSIIYVKQNGNFIKYASSNEMQEYSVAGLNPGTYDLTVVRFGYEYELRQVTISAQNLIEDFYLDTLNPIGIVNINSNIPEKYSLKQNYPNPFNPVTNIEFNIASKGFVTLKVYDILGREIETLISGNMNAGTYKADFNASALPSGVYFYRLEAYDDARSLKISETRKMILVK